MRISPQLDSLIIGLCAELKDFVGGSRNFWGSVASAIIVESRSRRELIVLVEVGWRIGEGLVEEWRAFL